jgi:hypothetical protein
MAEPTSLADLLVVGCSDVLSPELRPVRLPPVFRWRDDPNRFLLPPFHITSGVVYNGTEVDGAELGRLVEDERLTLLEGQEWSARPDFELWMDLHGRAEYQAYSEVQAAMDRIYTESFRRAEAALGSGQLSEAERLCGICILANGEKLEPFFMKAAILQHWGRMAGVERLREITGRKIQSEHFEEYLAPWLKVIRPARSPMSEVATIRVAA